MEPTTRNYDFSERNFCPLLVASSWAPQKLLYIEVSIWSMRGPELFRPILHDQEQDGRFVLVSSVNVLAEKHYTHRHIWLRGPTFAALRRQRYGSSWHIKFEVRPPSASALVNTFEDKHGAAAFELGWHSEFAASFFCETSAKLPESSLVTQLSERE